MTFGRLRGNEWIECRNTMLHLWTLSFSLRKNTAFGESHSASRQLTFRLLGRTWGKLPFGLNDLE